MAYLFLVRLVAITPPSEKNNSNGDRGRGGRGRDDRGRDDRGRGRDVGDVRARIHDAIHLAVRSAHESSGHGTNGQVTTPIGIRRPNSTGLRNMADHQY